MKDRIPNIGVLGGMGPLASAEFVKTIYERSIDYDERVTPNVLLHSITQVPDRTESILSRQKSEFQIAFEEHIGRLSREDVDCIIITCFTSHHFLAEVDLHVRSKVMSIVDAMADTLLEKNERALLFASLGSYTTGLFPQMERYEEIRDLLVIPDQSDWQKIHSLVYGHLKLGKQPEQVLPDMLTLMQKYGVNAFAAGCTEFHLVSKYVLQKALPGIAVADPLITIADRVAREATMTFETMQRVSA